MQISGKTDIGQRRAENQDAFATGTLPSGGVWAIVCDGMGGHAGGSTASTMAVECIAERIKNGIAGVPGMSPKTTASPELIPKAFG